MAEKYLNLTGLTTFLSNLKTAYSSNANEAYSEFSVGQAGKLSTARTIALTGAVTGSVSFDGSGNVSMTTSHGAHTENVIESITVDGTSQSIDNKVCTLDLSAYAKKSDIASALNFKGDATGVQLAGATTTGAGDTLKVANGDVYTCTSDSGTFHNGLEYAATVNGTTITWTELGKYYDFSGYVQKTQKVNNKALSGDITLDGSDIALSSNYAVASSAAAPAASDSIDTAIGKLQKEIVDANAAAATYAFAEGTTNGAFQVTPTVGGVAQTAQSVKVHGLGSAAYTASSDYVSSSLTPAEAGAQVNVIEEVQVNGVALTPTNKAVNVVIPAATVTDVQVKAHGANSFVTALDGTVAKIDLSGLATLSDISVTAGTGDYVTGISYNSSTGAFTETKAAKGSVADNNTGLVDGNTVYDYIEGLAISTESINGLFPTTT